IEDFLKRAEFYAVENIKALICPHAGYIYSGQVAAYSYKQITNASYKSVFIIAPSHSEYFDFNSIYYGKAYETPLGLVEIDAEKSQALVDSSPSIKFSYHGHRSEHSLEVQLPFLQVVLKDFKIVPIVMGRQSKRNIEDLGNTIGNLFLNENILIVASTDLSHYHPYSTAVSLDSKVKDYIENFDIEGLENAFLEDTIEMCGGGPVISAMIAAKIMGAKTSRVLCYRNSGDVTGDTSAVVGYLSCAIY
ncbi:MAG: AmmeMemoRadiSam system protein B, partial [Actinobacteria bacterium]|nr:AmmeMemoRadiSam system protein B [Actinomycetota bacterium]